MHLTLPLQVSVRHYTATNCNPFADCYGRLSKSLLLLQDLGLYPASHGVIKMTVVSVKILPPSYKVFRIHSL